MSPDSASAAQEPEIPVAHARPPRPACALPGLRPDAARRLRRGSGVCPARHRRPAPLDDRGRIQRDFALCHFLPGPNIVNLSMVFGSRLRGIAGGVARLHRAVAAADADHDRARDHLRPVRRCGGADSYAIAQLSPGPNVLIVTLIGYAVAGIPGALAATLTMCLPTALLAYYDRSIAALLLTAAVAVIASVSRASIRCGFCSQAGCWVLLALCDENR